MSPGFSRQELSDIRLSLLTLRERLRMKIPHDLIEVCEPALDNEPSPADSADIVTSLRRVEAERVLKQLNQVEDALNRLDGDGFGVCVSCGRNIELQLLKDDLTHDLCTNCAASEQC